MDISKQKFGTVAHASFRHSRLRRALGMSSWACIWHRGCNWRSTGALALELVSLRRIRRLLQVCDATRHITSFPHPLAVTPPLGSLGRGCVVGGIIQNTPALLSRYRGSSLLGRQYQGRHKAGSVQDRASRTHHLPRTGKFSDRLFTNRHCLRACSVVTQDHSAFARRHCYNVCRPAHASRDEGGRMSARSCFLLFFDKSDVIMIFSPLTGGTSIIKDIGASYFASPQAMNRHGPTLGHFDILFPDLNSWKNEGSRR